MDAGKKAKVMALMVGSGDEDSGSEKPPVDASVSHDPTYDVIFGKLVSALGIDRSKVDMSRGARALKSFIDTCAASEEDSEEDDSYEG